MGKNNMERLSGERIKVYRTFLNPLYERRNAIFSSFCRYAIAFSIGLNFGVLGSALGVRNYILNKFSNESNTPGIERQIEDKKHKKREERPILIKEHFA